MMIQKLRTVLLKNSFTQLIYHSFFYLVGRIITVDTHRGITPLGFKCGRNGRYPLTWFLMKPKENKVLENFYSNYQIDINNYSKKNLNILEYIYLKYTDFIQLKELNPRKLPEFKLDEHDIGPHSQEYIRYEKERLNRICHQLKNGGYRPFTHPDGFIRGYFIRHKKQKLFVVMGGQHRFSALSALGYKKIKCRIQPGYPKILTPEKLYHSSKKISPKLIDDWFKSMFDPKPKEDYYHG